MRAPRKAVEAIRKACQAGRVSLADSKDAGAMKALDEVLAGRRKPDSSLTKVKAASCWGRWRSPSPCKDGSMVGNDGGFDIRWETRSCGWGRLTFYVKKGRLFCDNQHMSRRFIKKVLCRLADEVELEDE